MIDLVSENWNDILKQEKLRIELLDRLKKSKYFSNELEKSLALISR